MFYPASEISISAAWAAGLLATEYSSICKTQQRSIGYLHVFFFLV